MEVAGLRFELTCVSCPEQYDVFDKDDIQVGYVRLRHGYIYASCPDVGGELVYENAAGGFDAGNFKNQIEREFHLREIAKAINQHYNVTSYATTPEAFAERMQEIRDRYSDKNEDEECRHIEMDELMMSVLRELGYSEGVAIFDDTPKWYA